MGISGRRLRRPEILISAPSGLVISRRQGRPGQHLRMRGESFQADPAATEEPDGTVYWNLPAL